MSDNNISQSNEEKIEENNVSTDVNKGNLFVIMHPSKKATDSTFNTSAMLSKFISGDSLPNNSEENTNIKNQITTNDGSKTTKNLFVVYKDNKIKKTGKKRSPYNLVDSNIRKLIIKEALRGRLLKNISEEFSINYSTIKTIWAIYRDELRTERKRGIKKCFTQNISASTTTTKKFNEMNVDINMNKESKKSNFFKNYNFNETKSSDSETDEDIKLAIEKDIVNNSCVIKDNKINKIKDVNLSNKILSKKRLNSQVNVRKYLNNNSELSLFTIHSAQNSSSNENKSHGKRSNSSNFTCNYSLDEGEDGSSGKNKENKRKKDEQKTCITFNVHNNSKMLIEHSNSEETSKKFSSKEDFYSSDKMINDSKVKDIKVGYKKSTSRLNFSNKYKSMIDNDFNIFAVKKTNSSNQISCKSRLKIDVEETDFLSLKEKETNKKYHRKIPKEKCKFTPDFINKFETNLSINDYNNTNNLEIENVLKQVINHANFVQNKTIKDSDIMNDNLISEFLKTSVNFKKILLNNETSKIIIDDKLSKFKDITEKFSNLKEKGKDNSVSALSEESEIKRFLSNSLNKNLKLDKMNSVLKQYENQINCTLNSSNNVENSFSNLSIFDNLNAELESINKNFLSMFNKSSNFDYSNPNWNSFDQGEDKEKDCLNDLNDLNISNFDVTNKYNLEDTRSRNLSDIVNEEFQIADFLQIIEKKYKQFEKKVQLKISNKEIEDNTFNNLNSRNQSKLHFLFTFNYFFEFMKKTDVNNGTFNEFFILMLSYLELLKNKCLEEDE